MFTGIIEETGTVQTVKRGRRSSQLSIRAVQVTEDARPGDSICVNGVCLTVTSLDKQSFSADVMPETLSATTLGTLQAGDPVNLERALLLNSRLGGHLVSGHIDGTGRIDARWKDDNAEWFRIMAPADLMRYIAEKGSVAIDGISLTIVKVDPASFTVSVIPFTRAETTITLRKAGDRVNIECDLIAKYTEKLMNGSKGKGAISLDFLAEKGFIDGL